jgi:hypothetical protein
LIKAQEMGGTVELQAKDQKLKADIETRLDGFRKALPFGLPKRDSELTRLYVERILGNYNFQFAKKDSDQAVELLYIAYNTTAPSTCCGCARGRTRSRNWV